MLVVASLLAIPPRVGADDRSQGEGPPASPLRRLALLIEKDPGLGKEVLPYDRFARRIFGYAGIAIVGPGEPADATLRVNPKTAVLAKMTFGRSGETTSAQAIVRFEGTVSLLGTDGRALFETPFSVSSDGAFTLNRLYPMLEKNPRLFLFHHAIPPSFVRLLAHLDRLDGLIAARTDEDDCVREAAEKALASVESTTDPQPLLDALRSPHLRVRKSAAQALGRLGLEAAVEALIALAHPTRGDGDQIPLSGPGSVEDVRAEAVRALARIDAPRATAAVIEALSDRSDDVRRAAVIGLRRPGLAEAVQPLLAALPGMGERSHMVIETLGEIGDPRAVDALLPYLEDRELASGTAGALARIKDRRALEPMIRACERLKGHWGRSGVLRALRELTGQDFGDDLKRWKRWAKEGSG